MVRSCMVHKGDMQIISNAQEHRTTAGTVLKALLVVAPPTYNIVNELKEEGDWAVLQKYSGFEFDDSAPKSAARTSYENIMYLERPGCNLCMGNQEKAEKGDTVMATSTRLFQGRVVADTDEKKGESLLASTPVVVLSTILGRTPSIDEYIAAVEGIKLTNYAPPVEEPASTPDLVVIECQTNATALLADIVSTRTSFLEALSKSLERALIRGPQTPAVPHARCALFPAFSPRYLSRSSDL